MSRAAPEERPEVDDYRWHRPFPTRWNDDDVYGHVNNTIYYAAMDTTITAWLLTRAGLDPLGGDRAVAIASSCRFHASGVFPDTLLVGLRADRIGTTSVSWGLGIFRESDRELLATGTFTHVFVDPEGGRPVAVPARIRTRVAADLVR